MNYREATALLFAYTEAMAAKTIDGTITPQQALPIIDLAEDSFRKLVRGEKIRVTAGVEMGLDSAMAASIDKVISDTVADTHTQKENTDGQA